ncbi:nucleotidyl transferase AbiEii/AbiGii toxin family protein [Nocardia sp. alder85J]|uniref:nucleotidyl transferase AbiEii/AbiGii toxin family protein n=1 Tax=Nocardia sp. alder85J TaxID=2862949 RepID=UPI001CD7A7C8|nr:nucleotidyl transferase AbiEii/AbiGii toxin family protein [Nocardia sp. alder85J]MCX4099242.1 nucleotidyl transferase AbiEii/AbiGii toxin family protein [Nocardia sp. alder85J]
MAREYNSKGFQRVLNDLARQAATGRRTQTVLLREFFMQRFLARVFDEQSGWILKGGISLLVRLPGARASEDVDLLHTTANFDAALKELGELVLRPRPDLDPLTFQLERKGREDQSGFQVLKVQATPYHGTTKFQHFSIDLTVGRTLVGDIDYLSPQHAFDHPAVVSTPRFACYPLADQIADKFAAMYEDRSGIASTRYRDLVDLLLIIDSHPFDAAKTLAALHKQVEDRELLDELPIEVRSPGPRWEEQYPALAKTTSLPSDLHALASGLELLGACMNPLLNQSVTAGTWKPEPRTWWC